MSWVEDIDIEIVLQLDYFDILSISLTCNYFNTLCDTKLWKRKFRNKYKCHVDGDHRNIYRELLYMNNVEISHYSIINNHLPLLRSSISKSININSYLAFEAIKIGNLKAIELLLTHDLVYPQAIYDCYYYKQYSLMELFISKGFNINENIIVHAVRDQDLVATSILIAAGVNINVSNDLPLTISVINNNCHIVELLLLNGANIHSDNDCALRLATNKRNTKLVNLLIQYGANTSVIRK